ncbi:MAG TPA: hypothetical protein VF229_03680, partial [Burkholderiaceae bacterium]
DLTLMGKVLARAAAHKGTAFVEILQNCMVFNDGAYAALTDKATREDARLVLEHGRPMVFGRQRDRGIRLRGLEAEVVALGQGGVTEADLLVHDENAPNGTLAGLLAGFEAPDYPLAMGILRAHAAPTYDELNARVHEEARAARGRGDLHRLLNSGQTWTIEPNRGVEAPAH